MYVGKDSFEKTFTVFMLEDCCGAKTLQCCRYREATGLTVFYEDMMTSHPFVCDQSSIPLSSYSILFVSRQCLSYLSLITLQSLNKRPASLLFTCQQKATPNRDKISKKRYKINERRSELEVRLTRNNRLNRGSQRIRIAKT